LNHSGARMGLEVVSNDRFSLVQIVKPAAVIRRRSE
jgi:hypothetical protein